MTNGVGVISFIVGEGIKYIGGGRLFLSFVVFSLCFHLFISLLLTFLDFLNKKFLIFIFLSTFILSFPSLKISYISLILFELHPCSEKREGEGEGSSSVDPSCSCFSPLHFGSSFYFYISFFLTFHHFFYF
uniref:Uncharacterized protein n=1 Tax=Solanum lycopersicum TaxID=4081 RepID=A0A3Q7IW60_SOLLC